MNEQQHKELEELNAFCTKKKEDLYQNLWYFVGGDDSMLRESGYKDLGDAARKLTQRTHDEIEKRLRAYERKWPT